MSLYICKVGSGDAVVNNRVKSSRMRTAMGDRQHDDPQAAAGGQSWVDRHRPSRSADLPVHHSKVRHIYLRCHSLHLSLLKYFIFR
jgi:hypothetical protein